MRYITNIRMKTLRLSIILLLVAVLLAAPVSTASAALRTCRTDPIVMLSDGHKVSLSVTMATDPSNVSEITYTLHVPQGAAVTKIVYTGGAFAKKEKVAVLADQQPGVFKSETVVHGASGRFAVTAQTMLMVGVITRASGMNGDRLAVEVRDPGTAPRNGRPPRGK